MKLDKYSSQARLLPALIAIIPCIVFFIIIWPGMGEWTEQLKTIGFGAIFYIVLAQIGGSAGRKREPGLFDYFGGKPTTVLIRHRDCRLDPQTKARYHTFLSDKIPGIAMPTVEFEAENPEKADEIYDSAVAWLRSRTRDNKLLLEDNISYGMRRNLLGLKTVGITSCILVGIATLGLNYFGLTADYIVLTTCVGVLPFWVFIVTPKWVMSPACGYAYRLLEYCDATE